MDFRPNDDDGPTYDVPFHDEARSQDGWQGQGTSLSYDTLKRDVTAAIARLGGVTHSLQRGDYTIGNKKRPGVRINYSLEGPKGNMVYGRIDVAALPIRPPAQRANWQRTERAREDLSIRMALYNVIAALRSQWVLKQLNPSWVRPAQPVRPASQTNAYPWFEERLKKK